MNDFEYTEEQGEDQSKIFDLERSNEAISRVCDVFDELGLSLFERWRVCVIIEKSATALMSDKMRELVESMNQSDIS